MLTGRGVRGFDIGFDHSCAHAGDYGGSSHRDDVPGMVEEGEEEDTENYIGVMAVCGEWEVDICVVCIIDSSKRRRVDVVEGIILVVIGNKVFCLLCLCMY